MHPITISCAIPPNTPTFAQQQKAFVASNFTSPPTWSTLTTASEVFTLLLMRLQYKGQTWIGGKHELQEGRIWGIRALKG